MARMFHRGSVLQWILGQYISILMYTKIQIVVTSSVSRKCGPRTAQTQNMGLLWLILTYVDDAFLLCEALTDHTDN